MTPLAILTKAREVFADGEDLDEVLYRTAVIVLRPGQADEPLNGDEMVAWERARRAVESRCGTTLEKYSATHTHEEQLARIDDAIQRQTP